MKTGSTKKSAGLKPGRSGTKTRRTYRLNLEKLAAAQRILGTSTATEAIESALDMVVFRQELANGTRLMLGVNIEPSDPEPR